MIILEKCFTPTSNMTSTVTSCSSSSSSSTAASSSSSLKIVSQFLNLHNCTHLLTALQTSSTPLSQTLRWPNSSDLVESQVQLVAVREWWNFSFSCALRIKFATPCFFVRLTDNHCSAEEIHGNVLTLESSNSSDRFQNQSRSRVETLLHCNVGDAIVIPSASVLCGLRPAVMGAEDLFAFVVRDSPVQCTRLHFDELPLPAKELVVTFLDVDTVLALGCASRACQVLINNSSTIWYGFALRRFGKEACQPELAQQWRERFQQMVVRQRLEPVNQQRYLTTTGWDLAHLTAPAIMLEWVKSEVSFVKHLVSMDRYAHELVRRGYVWFDCVHQFFAIHERYAADTKQLIEEHSQFVRQFAMREVPQALTDLLLCRLVARTIAMFQDPTWRANVSEVFVVRQRTSQMSLKIFDLPVEGAKSWSFDQAGFDVRESFTPPVCRIPHFEMLLGMTRRCSQLPFVHEMIALAIQLLQFTNALCPLTEMEATCCKLAPKRPLSDFLALTTAAQVRSWAIRSRPVHLILVPDALLVFLDDADANQDPVSLSLRGATVQFARDELCVTNAAGKTHKFCDVSSEFVMEMQKQLKTANSNMLSDLNADVK